MNIFASFPIRIECQAKAYSGTVVPFRSDLPNGFPNMYRVMFNKTYFGDITLDENGWSCSTEGKNQALIDAIGEYIQVYYG
jgi:hypothetical protein